MGGICAKRFAEHGFTPSSRFAQQGFTPSSRFAEHGFTLLELLISLLIFGMLASASVALLGFSTRAQSATTLRLNDVAGERRISALLIADMGQIVRRIRRDETGTPKPAFSGADANGLFSFVRGGGSLSDTGPRSGILRVTWRLREGRLERVTSAMIDGAAAAPPLVLATGVTAASVRFRDRGEWRADWSAASATALPRAIELVITRTGQPPITRLALVGTGY